MLTLKTYILFMIYLDDKMTTLIMLIFKLHLTVQSEKLIYVFK